ncbi:hypothetical protein B4U79_18041 [Dinothrombium tinctorium]|uniref:C2 domain-containing protein n=1 Tax=Dinothrombium tinctorium TaxID=1965070 RepID=A0A443R8N5_9ACAR|nr:hypothetical protein B4U79_18041 [Dinothrombium tinctorium]
MFLQTLTFICALVTVKTEQFLDSPWNYLCFMLHRNELIFDTQVIANGCKLKCITLANSGNSSSQFYDTSKTYLHLIKDGTYCDLHRQCINGECKQYEQQNRTGIVEISIMEASVPNKDVFTKSDVYVKVSIFGPKRLMIGKTVTITDNNRPLFNQTFSAKVFKSSTVIFEIMDKDHFRNDDYIATVFISLERSDGEKVETLEFPGGWLRVIVKWQENG